MEEIKLRIKSPSLSVPDIHLSCDQDETVLDVKKKIEVEYETHPLPGAQKLVYSGKLLKDEQKLRDFLRFEDECCVYTIHLVCKLASTTASNSDGVRNRKQKTEASCPVPVPSQQHSQEHVDQAHDLQAIQGLLNNFAVQGGMTSPQEMSADEMQQYQLLYTQYMNLYTQYIQNQSVQQQPEPSSLQPPQNQEPAAAVDDPAEEQGNNDLLDYAYAIIRVVILFCIMYVHSSFFRLLFVAVAILLVYMLQNRTQRRQHQRNNQERPPTPAPVEEARDNTEDAQGGPSEADSELDVETREPKPNIIMVAFTFVTTLFSSIIPDQIQAN